MSYRILYLPTGEYIRDYWNGYGTIVNITNLAAFCRENNLSGTCLQEVLTQKRGRTQHKGYKLPGR